MTKMPKCQECHGYKQKYDDLIKAIKRCRSVEKYSNRTFTHYCNDSLDDLFEVVDREQSKND